MTRVYNKASMLDRRRELRQDATQAEEILWTHVRRNQRLGIKFKRQYSLHGFVLDFYAPSVKLAIEIDGASHDREFAARRDQIRQQFIEEYGIEFLRFRDEEVLLHTLEVVSKIDTKIQTVMSSDALKKQEHLSPSPYQGEGLGERSLGQGATIGNS
jgi:very-short-patch-repair endonuclease